MAKKVIFRLCCWWLMRNALPWATKGPMGMPLSLLPVYGDEGKVQYYMLYFRFKDYSYGMRFDTERLTMNG